MRTITLLYEVPHCEVKILEATIASESENAFQVYGGSTPKRRYVPKVKQGMMQGANSFYFTTRQDAVAHCAERLLANLEGVVGQMLALGVQAQRLGIELPLRPIEFWRIIEEYQELNALWHRVEKFVLAGGSATDLPEINRLRDLEAKYNLTAHEILKPILSSQKNLT